MDALLNQFAQRYPVESTLQFERALALATSAHGDQKRESGEPYITHPRAVAEIVMSMGMDANSVIAAVLHDVVEDCENVSINDIESQFGQDVAMLVDGVTKLTISGKQVYVTKKQEQAENLRKLFLAIAADVRVVIIKLADRLHNMRTLAYCNPVKRERKAKETLEVYAPLAHRFGMGAIKGELEDLSFQYLLPDEYQNIKSQFVTQQAARAETLDEAMRKITAQMEDAGIHCTVNGRPKHLYSVYRKIQRLGCTINDIYDLIALRIIVDSVNDCYGALGVIHANWVPLPGRFKDYIATPKPNMYRSLHTTLLAPNGIPFEVQIRTTEMHRTAEYGIAAHWMYKEGRSVPSILDKKTSWLRQIIEAKDTTEDSSEFVQNILQDFLGDYVFVLTPKGEIIDLPTDSTPLDFAYRIHTNIGNHCQMAKVNGNIVRLDYKLQTNDVVEIITSNSQPGPSRDWLKIVRTQSARNKIRQWFKKENRQDNIVLGRETLAEEARHEGVNLEKLLTDEYLAGVYKRFNLVDLDDLYSAIGFGAITARQVIHKLIDTKFKSDKKLALEQKILEGHQAHPDKHLPVNGIIVKGFPDMAVRFSNCCNPLPGDPIIGYVTRGRGVSVHRADCTNAANLIKDRDRIIEVEWTVNASSSFNASIHIHAEDKPGTITEICQQLSSMNVNVVSINGNRTKEGQYLVDLSFPVTNADQLNVIMKNIRKLKCVSDVHRSSH